MQLPSLELYPPCARATALRLLCLKHIQTCRCVGNAGKMALQPSQHPASHCSHPPPARPSNGRSWGRCGCGGAVQSGGAGGGGGGRGGWGGWCARLGRRGTRGGARRWVWGRAGGGCERRGAGRCPDCRGRCAPPPRGSVAAARNCPVAPGRWVPGSIPPCPRAARPGAPAQLALPYCVTSAPQRPAFTAALASLLPVPCNLSVTAAFLLSTHCPLPPFSPTVLSACGPCSSPWRSCALSVPGLTICFIKLIFVLLFVVELKEILISTNSGQLFS